jgi:carotenoid cleavage dioxygenase
MPHDFVVTDRHLVLPIPPFHYEPDEGAETFLDAHRWHDDRPTRVLVVDKSDFSRHRWFELPAQWVFHYGNGWEDGDGVIHFDGARAEDPMDIVDGFSRVMRGERLPDPNSRPFRYRIDTPRGAISEEALFDANLTSEFPTVDPRIAGSRNRRLVMLTRNAERPPEHPSLDTVSLYDETSDSLRHYRYPAGVIPEEHLFVGAPGSAPETTGWIVGTSLNFAAGRTELNVFDARAIEDGPLATAALPYAVPLGFHGKFLS